MSEELKPCPFCGGAPNIASFPERSGVMAFYTISCGGCGISNLEGVPINDTPLEISIMQGVARWNRRSTQAGKDTAGTAAAMQALADYNSEISGEIGDYWFHKRKETHEEIMRLSKLIKGESDDE